MTDKYYTIRIEDENSEYQNSFSFEEEKVERLGGIGNMVETLEGFFQHVEIHVDYIE